jgi:hypothetical protein
MDEEAIRSIKRAHAFEEWAGRTTLPVNLFIRHFFLSESVLDGWRLLRATPIEVAGAPRLVQSLWAPEGGPAEALLRLDVYECDSRPAAHELLIRLVGQFQTSVVTRRDELGVGDVNFTPLGDGGVIFSRGNLVLVLSRAGTSPLPILDLARQVDERLTERPGGDAPRARRAAPAAAIRLARGETSGPREVELDAEGEGEGEAQPKYQKFFSSSGDLRVEGGRLIYDPAGTGPPEIEVYSIDPQGNADRQSVLPPESE